MIIRPGTTAEFEQIVRWQYAPPYDTYNTPESDYKETVCYFHELAENFVVIVTQDNTLLGFCSFGEDGQVPGGDYSTKALDIGMGMRPDLTGQGHGKEYLTAVLDYTQKTFQPTALRATIAAFNQRAQMMVKNAGFEPIDRFKATNNGREFLIFTKKTN
jgi:RimJ/RimL family protein N-acetyltransferase